jgi:cobalamin biosynthesis protein CobD/CbiB
MYCLNKDAQRTYSKALTAVLYGVLLCIVTFYIAVTIMVFSSKFIWIEYAEWIIEPIVTLTIWAVTILLAKFSSWFIRNLKPCIKS